LLPDVIAFFVGSNTILPGLESFCVYAAVAIFAIYVMQVTHFVAWMSLGKKLVDFKEISFLAR
jgi:Niemann-Pick C1 protein